MPRSIVLAAPAKLNLFLEVLGRRPDGYHSLSTVFQEISLADRLEARWAPRLAADEVRLECRGADLSNGPDNLVVRAARAFLQSPHNGIASAGGRLNPPAYRPRPRGSGGYSFHLTKRIPVGAGLGGGSSDAAAAIKALWRLRTRAPWKNFPADALTPLARDVGADVPFFLQGGAAHGRGVGERLRPLSPPAAAWFVLVFPRVFVSTKEVFQSLRFPLTKKRSCHRMITSLALGRPPREWAPLLFNRLEEVVLKKVPAVARAKHALLDAGCLGALMSGSGSSVFGVAASQRQGENVRQRLASGPWDVWLVRSVS